MRWLLLWTAASVPLSMLAGRFIGGPQPGLTTEQARRDDSGMTNTANPTNPYGTCPVWLHGDCDITNGIHVPPSITVRDEEAIAFTFATPARVAELTATARNTAAAHRGHGCPDDPTWDPETQTFRTPQMIRLEIALAKAHYYDSVTFQEANTRHDRLVALETELEALEAGCEAAADLRDPGDRWSADEDDHDTQPDPDRYEA